MYEQDPIHLRNSHIVAEACSRWLRARGLDYSMRDVIRESHSQHAINKTAKRKRKLDKLEFEEEMKTYEEQDETNNE